MDRRAAPLPTRDELYDEAFGPGDVAPERDGERGPGDA